MSIGSGELAVSATFQVYALIFDSDYATVRDTITKRSAALCAADIDLPRHAVLATGRLLLNVDSGRYASHRLYCLSDDGSLRQPIGPSTIAARQPTAIARDQYKTHDDR